MKLFATFLFAMAIATSLCAQLDPVKWSFAAKKISQTEYDLILTADVAKGWYVYSQYLESDEGPIATSFIFDENDSFELMGETAESGNKKEGYDEIFGMNLIKFGGKVAFTQRIKLTGKPEKINGSLEFMTCDDEQCLPPKTVDFVIPIK